MVIENLEISTSQEFKDKGNEAFKNGDWAKSIEYYTKAIKNAPKDTEKDLNVYYKNRAAAYLKDGQYDNVIKDCDEALKIVPTDPKTFFRKAQALENLQRYEEAYRDYRYALNSDPSNKAVQSSLERLHEIVQERARQHSQTSYKVEQMFKIAFSYEEDMDKRVKAIQNILVLAKESVGADMMFKQGVLVRIQKLLKVEKNKEIILAAIRTIGQICKNSVERTLGVINELGIPWLLDILNSKDENQVNAVQYVIQIILNTLAGVEGIDGKPVKELCDKHNKEIECILSTLLHSVTSRTISGLARDSVIELITKNIDHKMLDWSLKLIEFNGLKRLLEVASELQEYKYESCMEITNSTQTIISVCLTQIFNNMYYDEAKQKYLKHVEDYIKELLLTPEIESKVRATVIITVLLLGPVDIGNTIIAKEGILEMILVMAGTDDVLQQRVACECIIAASSKKDKALSIVKQGVDILKRLYQSKSDEIRVRALVGLCKVASYGGTDASIRPFADGSSIKLFEACKRFLIKQSKDLDLKRWAAEGLSYLTLDAEIKEKLTEDRSAIRALVDLAKNGNQRVLYGCITTLVNLCNAYDKEEVIPEMLELAKFAKQHIPEKHDLDDEDFINKRIDVLAKEGVTSALVALSKTESKNSKELISRVFNSICSRADLRGIVVQHGGAKALLPMALDGTEKGKKQAAQALARIGVTINPEVAFPGQRMLEVVRPLLSLLHPDCNALENFEALMTLCNIASVNDSTRARIIKEGGLAKIENYIFEDHEMLRRAAVQCITNLLLSEEVVNIFSDENDRIKYFWLLCMEEDLDTAKAAAGAIAILTSRTKAACERLFKIEKWLEIVHCLLGNPDKEILHRGVYIVRNLMECSKDVAFNLVNTNIMEILMALSKVSDDEKIKDIAAEALKAAEKWKLIENQE